MMRERNGHIDNGTPIRNGRKECPSCGSSNYIETLSREKCNSCGLECDYWGGGSNEAHEKYMKKIWADNEKYWHDKVAAEYGYEDDWRTNEDDD